jgi:type I restriction enzyme S subunit
MISDWKTMPARKFCASVRDGTHDSPKPVEHGEFLITSRHIVGRQLDLKNAYRISKADFDAINRRSKVDQWDVLISMIGTVGEPCLVKHVPNFAIKNIGLFKNKGADEGRWLFYYLQSPKAQDLIRQQSRGSTQQYIPLGALRDFPVSVPNDPRKMNAIAGVLGALDDMIEQNRRTARALERLAQAIFRAWFVDFEPVKAKAAGATAFPSMPQSVFDSLPTRFVNSDIGPVPAGWEVGAVSDLAVLSKEQVRPQEFTEELFKHFSIPAFDAGRNPVVERGAAIKSNKFLVLDGCVLLSKLNPRIPRVWLPPTPEGGRQIASTEFLVLIPNNGFDRHYLYCKFQQPAFHDDLAQSASGTSNSHQRVRPNDLLAKPVVMPPAIARDSFQDVVAPLFALLTSNHTESRQLAELRDYLLPRLLSGALRVKEAERVLETTP